MNPRRADILNELETAATTATPEASCCKTLCFQILYGLPWELQIEVASAMLRRYLPIFEKKCPDVGWPRRLLEDVEGWERTAGAMIEPPAGADSADVGYTLTFATFLTAYSFKEDDATCLTADVCGTLEDAVLARARHAWLADDPEAARLEREEDAYHAMEDEVRPSEPPTALGELASPAHSPHHNAAFLAEYRREWAEVAAWLRGAQVWSYPEPDLDAMTDGLHRWEAIRISPAGPTLAERSLLSTQSSRERSSHE